MPDARISELPAATSPADTDLTALVQTSGASLITNKATVAQLRGAVLDGRSAHVRDYGAKGDGTTNDAPAIQAAINDLATKGGGVLMFGAKTYRIASAISIGTVAVKLQGQGFVEGPSPGNGTWLKVDTTGFTPITFTGTAARGGGIADIAFFQAHTATQNASWAPTGYDYLIRIQDCQGGVDIHNVFLCSINKGIYCDNSGRLDIHRLRGQIFTTGVEIDDCFDVPRLRSIHFWPFSTTNTYVMAYSQANCDAMLFRRADGAFIDQAFVFGARSMFRFSGGTAGVTTKFYIGQAYADFVQYGVLVEGAGSDGLIDSLTTQGQAFGSAGVALAGAVGIRVTAPSCRLQIGKLRCDLVQDNAIRVEQYGNRLDIFALRCVNFNSQGNSSAAIFIADSGTSAANVVYLGTPPLLEGVTGPLQNSSSNGVLASGAPAGSAARPGLAVGSTNTGLFLPTSNTFAASAGGVEVLRATSSGGLTFGGAPAAHALEVATPAATGNRVLITGAATGGGVSIQAQGGDANVALLLADKGAGGIQASSNGGLTLKLDATGANPVNFVGIRAATGTTAALVYGAGSATNADLQLGAQGSGLVRGVTAPTADNSTAIATTAWVKSQGYGGGVSSVAGRTGAVTLAVADVSGAAPLTSAALVTPSLSGETYSYAAVTAGTNAQGQAALSADISTITTTPNNPSGVTLPAATIGRAITLINRGTNPVAVFPATGASIDSGAANAPVTLAVNGLLEFYATTAASWYSQINIPVAAAQLTGTLGVAQGGTGASTATGSGAVVLAASPALIGTPTVPTASAGTNTTQAASTAFVLGQGFITSTGAPVQTVAGRTGAVTLAVADVTGAAPLASPVFTGGGITVPSWATAGRPATPTVGMIGYNTDSNRYDHYTSAGWKQLVRLDGDTMTGALLANSAGGGNAARLAGAAAGGYVTFGIDSTSTDANPPGLVLQTKGTAALVLGATPDSTATGGNVRGANAVDLQTIRSAAAQVASGGNANIGGGLNNTASGTAATVAGGSSNTASAGNSTVAGGNSNTASGTGSFAAGVSNTAGGSYSSAPGGTQASAHGIYGAQVFATGFNVAQGDAQAGLYVLRGRSSAGAAVRLTADGTGTAGSVNVANLPLNTAWSGDMLVTARDTTTGNCCRWRISFGLGCAATAATTAYAEGSVEFANIIGSVAATANLVRSADTTNRGINLTFTPANSNTWDLVAVMRTAEVQ